MKLNIPKDRKIVEIKDIEATNDLLKSGTWRLERFSDRRNCYILVRKAGKWKMISSMPFIRMLLYGYIFVEIVKDIFFQNLVGNFQAIKKAIIPTNNLIKCFFNNK